jgi:hypothetical protein
MTDTALLCVSPHSFMPPDQILAPLPLDTIADLISAAVASFIWLARRWPSALVRVHIRHRCHLRAAFNSALGC